MTVVERVRPEDVDPVSQTVPPEHLGRYVGHQVSVRGRSTAAVGEFELWGADVVAVRSSRGGQRALFARSAKVTHSVASCSVDGCQRAHAAAIDAAQQATLEVLSAREEELRAPPVGF